MIRCAVNEDHHLLVTGSVEGHVEAWDPRARNRVGILDVARNCITSKGRLVDHFLGNILFNIIKKTIC